MEFACDDKKQRVQLAFTGKETASESVDYSDGDERGELLGKTRLRGNRLRRTGERRGGGRRKRKKETDTRNEGEEAG